jgi:hypothetical protein
MPHRILCAPLRIYGPIPSGPIEIKMTRTGIVFITAGGKYIQVTGGATGEWPSPVILDDPAVLDKLRQPAEVRRIEITYADGRLDVAVAEYVPEPRYRRQPMLPFGQALPLMPRPSVALPTPRVAGQMALDFVEA